MFFLPIGPQKWPNCPVKDFGSGSWGTQPPLFAAPRPKPSVGTPAGRVQDQDQDQEDEQEFVRSPRQPLLVILFKLYPGCWRSCQKVENSVLLWGLKSGSDLMS